jgi:GntR family transcriptional regulator / MocR family aminotransferase
MTVEWSTSGPDLLLPLDRASSTPLRAQLETQLRNAVRTGRLAAGERLPSSRALAGYLELSRGVVQECFEQLVAEGYLISRGGSATRVAEVSLREPARPRVDPPAAPSRLVADFQSGVPDLGLAPRDDWAWAVREACRTAPNAAFDYGDARGDARLRQVLAAYLCRVRAVDASPDRIVVCAGFQQGLGILLRTLAASGRTVVAVEDPGSIGTVTAAARAAHGDCVAVPVDEQGIDVGALEASNAQVAVVTPAHQWPTGVVLSAERRHELIAWAHERDAVIVEDDYDAEFRYDREPIGSLQGLAPERVVSLGTVSKSLAPALRLGWAVLPTWLVEPAGAAKQVADRGAPGLDQLALAALMESGRYDRHLRRMRAEYSKRRDTLVAALAEHAPQVGLTGLAAGFHAVAHLPDGADEEAVVAAARQRRVGLYGMGRYRASQAATPAQLVLGFGNTGVRAIEDGIAAVGPLLH